ncbi:putative transcription elongation factor S-II [Apostichopus japonicus]|uniref:Putative transcription elongation factor S-II n=1 Tax=Stichopus japonicus TaxID=307972 RepID=A0A2G8K6T1_STIJA|nr:putative transcription elongation factor S-II [Apostichopus japonicus]
MSIVEKEVLRIGKQLDKMVADSEVEDYSKALDLLQELKAKKITLDVLQKTRIGMAVNNLRTSSTKEDAEGKKQGNSEEDSRKEDGKSSNSSSLAGENSVREKCRQMIANALKTPFDEDAFPELDKSKFQDPETLSSDIEDYIL